MHSPVIVSLFTVTHIGVDDVIKQVIQLCVVCCVLCVVCCVLCVVCCVLCVVLCVVCCALCFVLFAVSRVATTMVLRHCTLTWADHVAVVSRRARNNYATQQTALPGSPRCQAQAAVGRRVFW